MTTPSQDASWAGIQFADALPLETNPSAIDFHATGWVGQIERGLTIETQPMLLDGIDVSAIPIRLQFKSPQTIGFAFPESPNFNVVEVSPGASVTPSAQPSSGEMGNEDSVPVRDSSAGANGTGRPPAKATRIRPPKDLIKLEDRLYFLLQPPLETLVASARLAFPFNPFPYQFEGIAFLFPREAAILADEMGLGKTMQAITTVRMLLLSSQLRNVLLICPKPLVTNWVREFRQWAPEIPVVVIEGDQAKRQYIWNQKSIPVRIANYELLMRDKAMLDNPELHFDLVILDEAQRIKNRNSTTSEIVRQLPRTRSWALTGTPIENSVEDLVSIFEFLAPGHIRSDMPLKTISQETRDFIIRRTKDKVLTEMPPKMFRDEELELTAAQMDSYRSAEDEGVVQLTEMGEMLTIQHVFDLVLRLKQICNFDPLTGSSCKLERLEADMEEIAASGQKAIVFSQWVETLEKIAEPLDRFGPLQYHGRIASNKRDAVIAEFKQNPKKHLILMSYGAGSVGLNLQFCQYVFLFDRWWNPAVEDQAINRAHRIGAAGPVTVTRMTTADTIEKRIQDVLEMKRELFNQLFAENSSPKSGGLSAEEIFGLFNLKPTRKAAA